MYVYVCVCYIISRKVVNREKFWIVVHQTPATVFFSIKTMPLLNKQANGKSVSQFVSQSGRQTDRQVSRLVDRQSNSFSMTQQ